MELYQQTEDVVVFGTHVKTFPNGITEAFGDLMKIFGSNRAYYGVSWMDDNDTVQYYAMAKKESVDESKEALYECLVLAKGTYETEAIRDWMDNMHCIKDVFQSLMKNDKPTKERPCVEWYRSYDEMLCMIKAL